MAAAAVTLHLTTIDALTVGQKLRTLARDRHTPLGVRDFFDRVGTQMFSAGRLAMCLDEHEVLAEREVMLAKDADDDASEQHKWDLEQLDGAHQ